MKPHDIELIFHTLLILWILWLQSRIGTLEKQVKEKEKNH